MKKVINILLIFIFVLAGFSYFYLAFKERNQIINAKNTFPEINSIEVNNEKLVVKFKNNKYIKNYDKWCSSSNTEEPNEFTKIENNVCEFDLKSEPKYIFLKNSNDEIKKIENDKLGYITDLKVNTNKVYLAPNTSSKIKVDFEYIGNINEEIKYEIKDTNIIELNNDTINALNVGSTEIIVSIGEFEEKIEVLVTDLIQRMPDNHIQYKPKLHCEAYNSEQAKLLDQILESRINDAGYQTRAGVVAAIRFLMLEFPYYISYSSENGRLNNFGDKPYVDGEGRYYHKGLYLHSDKFSEIVSSMHGPVIWGCPLYFVSMGEKTRNGLDCSGFVSWTMKNGGFDPGDVGSGLADEWLDLTDHGNKTTLTSDVIPQIKAGDLIGYNGHIAIVAGIKDSKTYVAEALWFGENRVEVREYSNSWLLDKFSYVMLMDDYYKEEGNYTPYWY